MPDRPFRVEAIENTLLYYHVVSNAQQKLCWEIHIVDCKARTD